MAVVDGTPQQATKTSPPEPELLNTLPDPRTPSSASTTSRNDSIFDADNPPELNAELAKLSEKLVNAINHQTSLDDTLQQTRHSLETARQQVVKLEVEAREEKEKFQTGAYLTLEDVEKREAEMREELAAERELRTKAEKEKKNMEQELETLTSALFQEANTMVSDARKQTEVSDKKIEQLKTQLRDNEVLLQSQQEQLADLKGVLEKMHSERDDESITHSSLPPSSPAVATHERMSKIFEDAQLAQHDPAALDPTPHHPLHFSHLIQPVLRTDVTAFEDFATLIKQARVTSPPPSRVVSGSFGSLNVLGPATSSQTSPATSSFPTAASSPKPTSTGPALRDSKVFKRAMAEDVEPTMRLDIAPGISWMVRRTVLSSIVDGALVVEPMPPSPIKFRGPINPCSLCGENRIGDVYARRHRFRISEEPDARRYPLCDLCLGRVRSAGDLLSFLRMVANGHWRADSGDEVKAAWEEYVRLRERMFWHRISGGVVPVAAAAAPSPAKEAFGAETGRGEEGAGKTEDAEQDGGEQVRSAEAETTTTAPAPTMEAERVRDDEQRPDAQRTESEDIAASVPGGFA